MIGSYRLRTRVQKPDNLIPFRDHALCIHSFTTELTYTFLYTTYIWASSGGTTLSKPYSATAFTATPAYQTPPATYPSITVHPYGINLLALMQRPISRTTRSLYNTKRAPPLRIHHSLWDGCLQLRSPPVGYSKRFLRRAGVEFVTDGERWDLDIHGQALRVWLVNRTNNSMVNIWDSA